MKEVTTMIDIAVRVLIVICFDNFSEFLRVICDGSMIMGKFDS